MIVTAFHWLLQKVYKLHYINPLEKVFYHIDNMIHDMKAHKWSETEKCWSKVKKVNAYLLCHDSFKTLNNFPRMAH